VDENPVGADQSRCRGVARTIKKLVQTILSCSHLISRRIVSMSATHEHGFHRGKIRGIWKNTVCIKNEGDSHDNLFRVMITPIAKRARTGSKPGVFFDAGWEDVVAAAPTTGDSAVV
jgi:hypothetical protein